MLYAFCVFLWNLLNYEKSIKRIFEQTVNNQSTESTENKSRSFGLHCMTCDSTNMFLHVM